MLATTCRLGPAALNPTTHTGLPRLTAGARGPGAGVGADGLAGVMREAHCRYLLMTVAHHSHEKLIVLLRLGAHVGELHAHLSAKEAAFKHSWLRKVLLRMEHRQLTQAWAAWTAHVGMHRWWQKMQAQENKLVNAVIDGSDIGIPDLPGGMICKLPRARERANRHGACSGGQEPEFGVAGDKAVSFASPPMAAVLILS